MSDKAISSVLVQDGETGERPIYFVSKVLRGAELRYQKIECLSLALVNTSRKLRHYFQGHPILVKTNFPIKQILEKPDLVGRMVTWAVELSEYNIKFTPHTSIKYNVLADFVVELSALINKELSTRWVLLVDGSSSLRGSGANVVLEGPEDLVLEYALCFNFQTSNNQDEYEALITGMKLAKEVGITHLLVRTDFQLVVGQVHGEF